ncbi:MAG: hypothetical protein Kow0073_05660 [Immundisolibacter sp.]
MLGAATVLLSLLGSSAQACERWLARLVSAQGPVQVQLAGSEQWCVATAGTTFCEDVSVRVGAAGSAALELANDTVLRLAPDSAVSIRQQPNAPKRRFRGYHRRPATPCHGYLLVERRARWLPAAVVFGIGERWRA